MIDVFREILGIVNESSPYLLLGFGLAGLLHVLLDRLPMITRMMTGQGARPVFMAAALGLPMPLCSCGVLPAALALRKQGASKGATSSFLISVPETDIVSIVLTYALLGPVLAVYRPVASLITAVGTGLFVNAVEQRAEPETSPLESDDDEHCEHCAPVRRPWLVRALRFGFIEMFDDIIGRLLFGIAVAGVLVWFLPAAGIEIVGGSALTYLLMLVIGVPVYVCATASTPVAVGLIAGGVSPGAAMVFLLAGPATNIAGLFVLARHFGRWALGAYLTGIAVFSVLLGLGLDRLFATGLAGLAPAPAVVAHEHGVSILRVASTVVLLLISAASLYRTKPWLKFGEQLRAKWAVWTGGVRSLDVSTRNPERCTPDHDCGAHEPHHQHGPGCGHEQIEHGGHFDYVVDGHLHHPHGDHCDDHGPPEPARS